MTTPEELMAMGLDREEADDLAHLGGLAPAPVSAPGMDVRKKNVNVFRCPTCGNVYRYDDEYEPMCTGPNWRDEHQPTVMVKVAVEPPRVVVMPNVQPKPTGELWVPGS